MIKKYIDFIKESNLNIPDHFVELKSIGHYLDTINGVMYPDDSYEKDEYIDVYDDLDDHDGLSEDDKRLIDSFRISSEELIGDTINLDLMDDIIRKSISEGLLDEDVDIKINAILRITDLSFLTNVRHIKVYNIRTPKENEGNEIIYTWNRFFKKDADIIKNQENIYQEDIYYTCVFTYIKRYEEKLKPKMDSVEHFIKDVYPDEQCSFHQLMDNYRTI